MNNDKPLPSIHVWQSEDDCICIDNKCVEPAIQLTSVVAWQQESLDSEESSPNKQNPAGIFLNNNMAHEATPLFEHRPYNDDSDIELDSFINLTKKSRSSSSKQLLANQADRLDRTSLSSLEDNRDDVSLSFASSHLVVSDNNVFESTDGTLDDDVSVISNPHSVCEYPNSTNRNCDSRLSKRSRSSLESRLSRGSSHSNNSYSHRPPEEFELEERHSSNENDEHRKTSETEFQLTEVERITEDEPIPLEGTGLLHQPNEAFIPRHQGKFRMIVYRLL